MDNIKTPDTKDSQLKTIPKTPKKVSRRRSYIDDDDISDTTVSSVIRNLDKDFQDCENEIVLNKEEYFEGVRIE